MKKICCILLLSGVALITGCASCPLGSSRPGRYITVINDHGVVIMTDTKTGQAWISGIRETGQFTDESFGEAKGQ
jgi:hypothetical protein